MKTWRGRGPSRASAGESDDRGSMPMALLVTLVGVSLSAILVPVVVSQIRNTRSVSARTHALDAALAGIDAALGQLRAAATAAGIGQLDKLPGCSISGSLDVGGPRYTYSVTIAYKAANGTLMGCSPASLPSIATLTATGTGSPPGSAVVVTRTVEAGYTFNTASGAVQLAVPRPSNNLCMDSGVDTFPAAGTPVTAQLCNSGSDQRFSYTSDRNIKLVGSQTAAAPAGMCIEAPLGNSANLSVTFQPCLGRTARQQWFLNGSSNLQGAYNDATLGSYCLRAQNAGVPGSGILIDSCSSPVLQQFVVPTNFAEPPALTTIREK